MVGLDRRPVRRDLHRDFDPRDISTWGSGADWSSCDRADDCVCHDGSLWMVWAAAKADRFSPADRRRSSNRSRGSDPTLSGHHRSDILRQVGRLRNGAGEVNRTLVISLEGYILLNEIKP